RLFHASASPASCSTARRKKPSASASSPRCAASSPCASNGDAAARGGSGGVSTRGARGGRLKDTIGTATGFRGRGDTAARTTTIHSRITKEPTRRHDPLSPREGAGIEIPPIPSGRARPRSRPASLSKSRLTRGTSSGRPSIGKTGPESRRGGAGEGQGGAGSHDAVLPETGRALEAAHRRLEARVRGDGQRAREVAKLGEPQPHRSHHGGRHRLG